MPWSPLATAQLRHFSMKTAMLLFSHSVVSLCDPMDCTPSGSSIQGARILEWVAISFSRGSF